MATVLYIALNAYIYYTIEIKEAAYAAFDYKPWTCRTCLTFWMAIWFAAFAALAGDWTFAITIAVIGSLDAAAKLIDEKERYGTRND